jgi:hypothetical protein
LVIKRAFFATCSRRIGATVLAVTGNVEQRFHSFTKAVRHEPSCFVGNAQYVLKLFAADAFLGCANQMIRIEPLVKWNLAILKYGANCYRELFAAITTEVKTGAMRLALQLAMRSMPPQ